MYVHDIFSSKKFKDLPPLVRIERMAKVIRLKPSTIRDWRANANRKKPRYTRNPPPKNLFYKDRQFIYVRKEVLKKWFKGQ